MTRHRRRLSSRRAERHTRRPLAIEALEGRQLLSLGTQFQVDSGNRALKSDVATAASSNGSSVVVWVESLVNNNNQIGDQDVRAQRFDAAGNKSGPEIYVAGKVGVYENEPSVAMDAQGDFVVSWTEDEANGDTNVLAHKFNASSVPIDGIVQVGVGTFKESGSSVAMDAFGDFVVAYTRVTNGNNPDVFAKTYFANAQPRNVITVAGSAKAESNASVAMNAAGGFDVAYQSQTGGANNDIDVARYSQGQTLLGVVPVATTSSNEQAPSIAIDSQGDAVVAYEKLVNNAYTIKARRISAAGSPGGEINVGTTGNASGIPGPSVAFQPNGGYAGAFAVAFDQQIGNGPYDLEVATVDGSNTVTHLYDLGDFYAPAITALGADGFLVTYASLIGGNLSDNILGRRGSYF